VYTPGACGGTGMVKPEASEAESASLSRESTNDFTVLRWTPRANGYARVIVTDLSGKVISRSDLLTEVGGDVNSYTIDATGWKAGDYIVRLSRGGAVASRKLSVGR